MEPLRVTQVQQLEPAVAVHLGRYPYRHLGLHLSRNQRRFRPSLVEAEVASEPVVACDRAVVREQDVVPHLVVVLGMAREPQRALELERAVEPEQAEVVGLVGAAAMFPAA